MCDAKNIASISFILVINDTELASLSTGSIKMIVRNERVTEVLAPLKALINFYLS